jgi:hypothetical protein
VIKGTCGVLDLTKIGTNNESVIGDLCNGIDALVDESYPKPVQLTVTPYADPPNGGARVFGTPEVISSDNPETTFSLDLGSEGNCGIVEVDVIPNPASVQETATTQLQATAFDIDDNPVTGTFTWSTVDASIAAVDAATGLLTGVKQGTTAVTALETNSGVKGTAQVTVASNIADRFMFVVLGGDSSGNLANVVIAVNDTDIGTGPPGAYKICNVPDGTSMSVEVTTNADLSQSPDNEILALNLDPFLQSISSQQQTFDYQADTCSATTSCVTDADVTSPAAFNSPILNGCVTIPGVNDNRSLRNSRTPGGATPMRSGGETHTPTHDPARKTLGPSSTVQNVKVRQNPN